MNKLYFRSIFSTGTNKNRVDKRVNEWWCENQPKRAHNARRQIVQSAFRGLFREAEISDLSVEIVLEKNVRGFKISVYNTRLRVFVKVR